MIEGFPVGVSLGLLDGTIVGSEVGPALGGLEG